MLKPYAFLLIISCVLVLVTSHKVPTMRKRNHFGIMYQDGIPIPTEKSLRGMHGDTAYSWTYLYGSINTTGEYFAAIYLGSDTQLFTVQVDTGSGTLAVPSVGCEEYQMNGAHPTPTGNGCGHQNPLYNPASSSVSNTVPCNTSVCEQCDSGYCTFQLLYGDGSFLFGDMGQDVFSMAGLSAPQVIFGKIEGESDGFEQSGIDGIMGLAYHSLDPLNGDDVFGLIVENNAIPDMFSMCMGSNGGFMVLGGVDDTYTGAAMQYTPVTQETYYVVSLLDFKVGSNSLGLNPDVWNPELTIVDSGTTLLLIPTEAYAVMTKVYQNNYCHNLPSELQSICLGDGDGNSMFTPGLCFSLSESDLSYFPPISLQFQGTDDLAIGPEYYFLSILDGDQTYYCFGIQPIDDGTIIGDVFMQAYNVLFDRQNTRVGFSPVVNCTGPNLNISRHSGDDQKGSYLFSLSDPIKADLIYEGGIPGDSVLVEFKVTQGDAELSNNGKVLSDHNGIASCKINKLKSSGTIKITATVSGTDQSVEFTVQSSVAKLVAIVLATFIGVTAIGAVAGVFWYRRRVAQKSSEETKPFLSEENSVNS